MNKLTSLYDALAVALNYPDGDFHERVRACRDLLAENAADIAGHLDAFAERTAAKSLANLEELYIRTFDLNPVCTLDTGWQLFGEEYNRGIFLVRMREEMRRAGVAESTELPDHLSHVLPVLGRMEDGDAENFAVSCVIPAVRKILDALSEDNPYRSLIEGIVALLEGRFGRWHDEAEDYSEGVDCPHAFASEEAGHG